MNKHYIFLSTCKHIWAKNTGIHFFDKMLLDCFAQHCLHIALHFDFVYIAPLPSPWLNRYTCTQVLIGPIRSFLFVLCCLLAFIYCNRCSTTDGAVLFFLSPVRYFLQFSNHPLPGYFTLYLSFFVTLPISFTIPLQFLRLYILIYIFTVSSPPKFSSPLSSHIDICNREDNQSGVA